jgi:hypothetical protein
MNLFDERQKVLARLMALTLEIEAARKRLDAIDQVLLLLRQQPQEKSNEHATTPLPEGAVGASSDGSASST